METISIVVLTIVSTIVETIAEPMVKKLYLRLSEWFDRAGSRYAPAIAPDRKLKKKEIKYGSFGLVFLGVIYMVAISFLSLKIYGIMNSPSQDMLQNSFNLSLNMAAIALLILNYTLYFVSTQAFRFISRQHEINRHAQSRIFMLEEQLNKG